MSENQELTYADVSAHNSKKDIYVVIHDKVYNVTNFIDEHPGGEEVLLDVGGQDATEAFEDVGHSDEARTILNDLKVGELKRKAEDPKPKIAPPRSGSPTNVIRASGGGIGAGIYALILFGGLAAFGAYKYLQASSDSSK